MSTLMIANGSFEPGDWIEAYSGRAKTLVAVDGGLRYLAALGLSPDLVVGDLDSIEADQLAALETRCEVIRYPADKDETDLELALLIVAERFSGPVWVAGAFGGRLDQHLANILLLTHNGLRQRSVRLIAPYQEMWLIRDQAEIRGKVGDTISLIPLAGDVLMKATTGLKWPLVNEELQFGPARGISNVMTDPTATVEILAGQLLCIHTDGAWQR